MKNITILAVFCLILSSCGLFKSTFKHKSQHSEVTKVEISDRKDSTGTKIDKSKIQTTTTTTVTEAMPDKKVYGQVKTDKNGLQNGVDIIDSAGVTVKVYLDSVTQLLKAMASIKGGTKTIESRKEELRSNDIQEHSGSTETHNENKQIAVEDKNKTVEKTPNWKVIISVLVVVFLFVFVLVYLRRNKK
ncbi:hypothetical protein QT327_10615 [Olivibacter sp. 47]|uniref:hypothetical protein n=1 Tax=Olivibacter sp. 47 TaxID=3056486 RepID=UPI0025A3704D|nr:hypothetical protein [Olivibacter sp. 47]MDM8174802.1 hypothetical protein [Olivibacter sp. 47]